MKTFKRFGTLLLAVIMLISSVSITAFAAENNAVPGSSTVIEFDITPEMMSRSGTVIANNTWNITGSHTGSTRAYYGNTIRYQITVTDINGNPVGNILSVQLYNSLNAKIYENQLWADGKEVRDNIPISYGSSYYFQYALAYGDMRPLKIHMIITIL